MNFFQVIELKFFLHSKPYFCHDECSVTKWVHFTPGEYNQTSKFLESLRWKKKEKLSSKMKAAENKIESEVIQFTMWEQFVFLANTIEKIQILESKHYFVAQEWLKCLFWYFCSVYLKIFWSPSIIFKEASVCDFIQQA